MGHHGAVNRQSTTLLVIGAVVLVYAVERHIISTTSLLLLAVVVPSIILHEVSHGVVALWFGDDTAKRAGRLTLNPIPHIDPFGTIILPAVLTLSGAGAFGYAKPVPVDVSRMRSPRNDSLIVSLAGPFTNILLAGATVLWLRFARPPSVLYTIVYQPGSARIADRLIFYLGYVNVILATFNLLPLPPLDGSAVVERLLPRSWWPSWLKLRQYAMPVLLVVVLLLPGTLSHIFNPALRFWGRVLRA
jgi:Zn-dependent protease